MFRTQLLFITFFTFTFLNTASASSIFPTQAEIQQNMKEFVLENIRQDERYSYLVNSVEKVAFEKKSQKTVWRHPSCGAAWMGTCPKMRKEKNVITTKSYLAYGKDFTCRVKAISHWSKFEGSNLVAVDVDCFSN